MAKGSVTQTLQPECLGSVTSYRMTLGMLFNLSVPLFPHL